LAVLHKLLKYQGELVATVSLPAEVCLMYVCIYAGSGAMGRPGRAVNY